MHTNMQTDSPSSIYSNSETESLLDIEMACLFRGTNKYSYPRRELYDRCEMHIGVSIMFQSSLRCDTFVISLTVT